MYQYSDGDIEPIVLKFPKSDKKITYFNNDSSVKKYVDNKRGSKGLNKEEFKLYIEEMNKFIYELYSSMYEKQLFIMLTAKQTFNYLDKKNIQLVDSFHKVLYILDENIR